MTVGLTARVVRGLEWVAADEIDLCLTASHVVLGPREVRFTVAELGAAVTALRTVDDVFVRVGTLRGVGRDRRTSALVAAAAARLDLASALASVRTLRPVARRPGFDVVASIDGDRRFNRYDLEDALGDALSPTIGGHYGSRRAGPPPPGDLSVRVAVAGERAEVMVRVSSGPLHRRPWKRNTAPATLHPPVAAALLRLAGCLGSVVDPFCGDGTIPIEAVLAGGPIWAAGSDLDSPRVANARANAQRAGLALPWVRADAARVPWRPAPGGAWVTNPPWNRSVPAAGGVVATLTSAWSEARRVLGPTGTLAVIVDADIGLDTELAPAGWRAVVTQHARLAGRLCRLVIAVPSDGPGRHPLSPTLQAWRQQSASDGLVTATGF